jgi:hypothetical protein
MALARNPSKKTNAPPSGIVNRSKMGRIRKLTIPRMKAAAAAITKGVWSWVWTYENPGMIQMVNKIVRALTNQTMIKRMLDLKMLRMVIIHLPGEDCERIGAELKTYEI